jgi:DNA-binding CsgD family transcriptional regulator
LLNLNEGAPDATPAEQHASAEFFGRQLSGPAYVRGLRAQMEADLSEAARQVRCRTLVMHAKRCTRVPFEEGRRLASLIPGARFMPVEGGNWTLHKSEPQFESVVGAVREFLQEGEPPGARHAADAASFTPREREVLALLARGLDNLQIAAHMGLSEKTVRNHITPIFDKLGVENRGQAIVRAREAGLGQA